ncbi:MAG: hypothetical protein ACI841_001612 [Planctomycetota bacterium]|jgi:hypothetical protein
MLRYLPLLMLCTFHSVAYAQDEEHEPALYIRIQLHGPKRVLSLAEVRVFSDGESIADTGEASQSSVASGGDPARAIDGNTDGDYPGGSVTHTSEDRDAWWELDLGELRMIDRVVIWNRTDCCGERLQGFSLQLLDKRHKLIWERMGNRAPSPRVEIVPYTEGQIEPSGPTREERAKSQPAIDGAISRGAQFLLQKQLWDGSFAHVATHYRAGATGLALYTLLKCSVPRTHPAVRRAVQFLLANPPRHTYELGTVLMAMDALNDAEHKPFMQDLLDQLLGYQGAKGEDGKTDELWAYPDLHSEVADLSNTQYAALGLRAAKHAGLKVPSRVWTGMMNSVLRYQESPHEVTDFVAAQSSSAKSTMRIGGFPYRVHGTASSSMTTAGLGILAICIEGLDNPPRGLRRKFETAKELAEGWLAYNFSVTGNFGGDKSWLLYYLYGLERVGGLLEINQFGIHDWYWEGAKQVVTAQDANGSWTNGHEADTCFALLFLARATARPRSKGENDEVLPAGTWIAERSASDVRWRITGGDQAVFFVTSFSESAIADHASGQEGRRAFRVARVDYLVNGEVVQSMPGDAERKWAGERFAARHTFESRGDYLCEVRVFVRPPEDAGSSELIELEGEALVVKIASTEVGPSPFVEAWADNLLEKVRITASASSENLATQNPALTVDGLLGTYWIAGMNDANPTLTLNFNRSQAGKTLLIAHAGANEFARGAHDRATRLQVVLNGNKKNAYEVEAPDGDDVMCRLDLKKVIKLRKVEITILDRVVGSKYPKAVGFSEVLWLK